MQINQAGEYNTQIVGDGNIIIQLQKSEFKRKLEMLASVELWGLNLILYGVWCLIYIAFMTYNITHAKVLMSGNQLVFMILLLPLLFALREYLARSYERELKVFSDHIVYNGEPYMFDDYILVSREHFLFLKSPYKELKIVLKRKTDVDAVIRVYANFRAIV